MTATKRKGKITDAEKARIIAENPLPEWMANQGIEINREGKTLCPFHVDKSPSLHVYDDHAFCFA